MDSRSYAGSPSSLTAATKAVLMKKKMSATAEVS